MKRYDLVDSHAMGAGMEEHELGDWVKWDDVERLQALLKHGRRPGKSNLPYMAEIERLRTAMSRIANYPAPTQAATGDAMKGYMEALSDVGAVAEQALRGEYPLPTKNTGECERCLGTGQLDCGDPSNGLIECSDCGGKGSVTEKVSE
jgi:hypothetical protein